MFASEAFIATPLTLDHDYLLENIDRLGIGTINSDATAIGDGITTALNRLRELKSKSKIIVLMTDGGNNSGKIDPSRRQGGPGAGRENLHHRPRQPRNRPADGAAAGLFAGRGHVAANRGHDRRKILSRGQRGKVPENLRGD